MNREEIKNSRAYQVSKAALEYYNEHYQDKDFDLTDAFEEGAKWADENPNNGKELLYVANQTAERTKKEVIEKACDWIQMNANKYINAVGGCLYFDIVNATNNFRKAMES